MERDNLYQIANESRLDRKQPLERLLDLQVSPSRFQSILIELAQKIVAEESVEGLVQHYEENRFTEPCSLPQREIIRLEEIMYQELSANYVDIELSPIAPLGTNSILTGVSQRGVLSTVRNTEILADPTTILVLECLKRLRDKNKKYPGNKQFIDLATSARCTRAQLFPKESGFVPHFKVFALASGNLAKEEKNGDKIIEHLSFFLDFFDRIRKEGKYSTNSISVKISNINIMEKLIGIMGINRSELGRHSQDSAFDPFVAYGIDLPNIIPSLDLLNDAQINKFGLMRYLIDLRNLSEQISRIKEKHPDINIVFDLARIAGIGYYNGLCIKIIAYNSLGNEYPLVDGGYSDWLTKLTTNRKSSFCSSGFGLELFGKLFKNGQ